MFFYTKYNIIALYALTFIF